MMNLSLPSKSRTQLVRLHPSKLLFKVFLLGTLLLCFGQPLAAQTQIPDDAVNEIAKKLYCPVCENIPLDACGTAACIQWREEIRIQLGEGSTEQQVIDDFVSRFGERVVGTPQDPTLRALSLITPWALAGIALLSAVYVLIRLQNRRHTAQNIYTSTLDDGGSSEDYRLRIEGDLKERH